LVADALEFRRRREPGRARAFLLALAVHAVLVAVILVGVRWQSHKPETVTVELWDAAPPPPPPAVEPPKPPPEPPKPEPKPPPEPPKPEPKIEKPVIVEKAPPPKPKPKAEPKKPEPKPKPKPEAKPKPDPEFEKRLRAEAAAEQQKMDAQSRLREERAAAERQAAAARQKALDAWTDRIAAKIRGNIVLPPDLAGNPEAIFDVALLPTGEVLTVRRRKSSGHAGYDAAVERAIYKASPLPKPDQPSSFRRDLELKFRPKDQ
jgi:colicin import membrane protein